MNEEELKLEKEKQKEEERENRRYWIVIIILLIIIILLLLMGYKLISGLSNNETLTPSGNIDIFELNCDENCSCNTDDDSDTSDEIEVEGEVELIEGNDTVAWNTVSKLRIFENPLYDYNELVAPESTNVYEFIIRNNTNVSVRYTITFDEVNEYNINMMYKLSNATGSINTDWVTYDELLMSDVYLASGASDTYYLEWKWFESDNDTEIGVNSSSYYTLNMNLVGYQV